MLKQYRTTMGHFRPENRFATGWLDHPEPPDDVRNWTMVGSAVTPCSAILWFWEADCEDDR